MVVAIKAYQSHTLEAFADTTRKRRKYLPEILKLAVKDYFPMEEKEEVNI